MYYSKIRSFGSNSIYLDINFMVTDCYHTFLLDMYNHMMFDKKCKLDIGIFLKKIKDMETNKRKR